MVVNASSETLEHKLHDVGPTFLTNNQYSKLCEFIFKLVKFLLAVEFTVSYLSKIKFLFSFNFFCKKSKNVSFNFIDSLQSDPEPESQTNADPDLNPKHWSRP